MNYPDIILNAYLIENNREHLEAYFTSQFKQAEQTQFVEAELFFNGCIKAIESWENDLRRQVNERKKELYSMLMVAKRGSPSGNEQERLQTIEYCQQELKDERPDGIGSITYNVHLHSLTSGRVQGNVPYSEVLKIKLAILEAYKKALPIQDASKLKPESPFSALEWATIYYYAEAAQLVSDSPKLKERLIQFMEAHQVSTTLNSLTDKYYKAKNRINEKKDYPIENLHHITPFIRKHYKRAVTFIENDIQYLKSESAENQDAW